MGRLAGIARREKKRAPMETLESAEINATTGVAGDSRGKPGNRQVTLLSARDWQAACEELGADVPWTTRRANLLVDDMDLPKAAGHIVAIGPVRLRTTIEVDPCSRMDEQAPGLRKALQDDWRGGVACEVIEGGLVSVGDDVSVIE
jgi:MOSC domain-containing protein YiiM